MRSDTEGADPAVLIPLLIPLLRPVVSRVARGDRGRTDCAGERRLAAGRGCSRLWEQAGS